MSYSATIQAATKHEVRERLAAYLDEVVERQPEHAHDRKAVIANADAALDLVADSPDQDVMLTIVGSVSTSGDEVTAVHISASVGRLNRG